MEKKSFYDLLGLPRDASAEEIRHAYRQLVLHLHPDTNQSKGETELFIDIQSAYEHLSDSDKKADYDNKLGLAGEIEAPLNIRTYFSQSSLVRLDEPQLVYTLIEVNMHPETGLLISSAPLNISLVVDCSTSMQGVRLDTVKSTAIELIRQLHSDDIFSLVKFNDFSELLVPAGRLADIKSMEMKIQLLQAGGGTEIYKGLELGYSEVNRFLSADHVNHMIIITDGRTYGDEINCLKLADQASTLGIGISALGIGNKWNDTFLDHITSKTGGICKYVSDASDIRNSINDEITRLGSSLTEQITYNFSSDSSVEIQSAFRLQPDASPLVLSSQLVFGFIPRNGEMNILVEFLVKDIPADTVRVHLANGFLNYKIPRHPLKTQYVQRLILERAITDTPSNETPPAVILNAISLLSLYRMQERARDEVAKGDLKSATRHLDLLATHLYRKGEVDLAQSVLDEVDHIQQHQTFSEDGEKRIKYGTRSLLLPAKIGENKP